MSKARFTTTDVKAMVRDIRATVMGQRVANVYDLSDKCYLFKFAVPGKSAKVTLLMESGLRFHTTKYARDLPEVPSAFAMKLRKFIRTKRLEDVQQIGIDRVVDFKFGSGDAVNHVILELYANGNIVLTDGNYEVLALLRSHQFEEDVKLSVGEVYPVAFSTNVAAAALGTAASAETQDCIASPSDRETHPAGVLGMAVPTFRAWAARKLEEYKEFHAHEELVHAASVAVRQASLEEAASKVEETASTSTKRATKQKKAAKALIEQQSQSGAPKKKKVREMALKQLLLSKDSGVSACGPEVLDHCLLRAQIKPSTRIESLAGFSEEQVLAMQRELARSEEVINLLNSPGMPGFIIVRPVTVPPKAATLPAAGSAEEGESARPVVAEEYVEYLPMMFAQHDGLQFRTYPSFDEAVDEYYCKVEDQRLEREAQAAELSAQRKMEKIKRDQEKMQQGLAAQQSRMQHGAMLLELYAEQADKVALVINSALASGMTWEDIAEMVKAETAAGNPIASLITRLKLDQNKVYLRLRDVEQPDSAAAPQTQTEEISPRTKPSARPAAVDADAAMFDSDSEGETHADGSEKTQARKGAPPAKAATVTAGGTVAGKYPPKTVEVEFDLNLSAFANARNMYTQKKIAYVKEVKTVDASVRVLQQVGDRVQQNVDSQKLKRNLRAVRKIHWFEKFDWCISSEGYLILSGRDAQQNEILFKRYLRPTDIYVHADISGAASCIVRAKSPAMQAQGVAGAAQKLQTVTNRPISPLAIQEAGVMAVSRSSAWKGKIGGVAAWWVWASQVSKSAPTGEYLTTGSFMIHGKKNFLPPMALEMGFGIMFRLDDASVARHLKDWKDRSYLSDERSMSVFTENLDRYSVSFNELGPDALCLGDSGGEQEDSGGEAEEQPAEGDKAVAVGIAAVPAVAEPPSTQMSIANPKVKVKTLPPVPLNRNEGKNSGPSEAKKRDKKKDKEEAKQKGKKVESRRDKKGANDSDLLKLLAPAAPSDEENEDNKESDPAVDEDAQDFENSDGAWNDERDPQSDPQSSDEEQQQRHNGGKGSKGKKEAQKTIAAQGKDNGKKPPVGKKGNKTQQQDQDEDDDLERGSDVVSNTGGQSKKKHISKKKARRYAEQDDEDRELAMLVLGHASAKTGERLVDKQVQVSKDKKTLDIKARQEKAGIGFVAEESWEALTALLSESVRAVLEGIIGGGFLKAGELGAFEMKALAAFPPEQGVEILYLFSEGSNLKKAGNKSGFLAGIMRRYTSSKVAEREANEAAALHMKVEGDAPKSAIHVETEDEADQGEAALSRRALKKQEQAEIQAIIDQEGIAEEDEGKQADEVEKLTGVPLPDDVLLYAVPVCGPYAALQNFKYKVKLTPGPGKKGKICKQALELFTRARECSATEKSLMNGLTDPEMVAIMIGEVRMSMPGLHSLQLEKRTVKKARGQKKP